MDNETVQAITTVAETITTIGVLLLWVWAERRDNRDLFHIIQALSSLRLRQIEREENDKAKIESKGSSADKNQ